MDSTQVNWEALDRLVLDFAKSENLIDNSASTSTISSPSSSPSPSFSSSYQSRFIIRQIRRFLESSDIDSSLHLLRSHAPFILDDHRLLFQLQKQKFMELLRRGTDEAKDSAIECTRMTLAPCALDAYQVDVQALAHAHAVELTRRGQLSNLRS